MVNRRQSIFILIIYFIIYALPSVLVTAFHQLGAQVFVIQTVDYLVGAILLIWLASRMRTKNVVEKQPSNWFMTVLSRLKNHVVLILA